MCVYIYYGLTRCFSPHQRRTRPTTGVACVYCRVNPIYLSICLSLFIQDTSIQLMYSHQASESFGWRSMALRSFSSAAAASVGESSVPSCLQWEQWDRRLNPQPQACITWDIGLNPQPQAYATWPVHDTDSSSDSASHTLPGGPLPLLCTRSREGRGGGVPPPKISFHSRLTWRYRVRSTSGFAASVGESSVPSCLQSEQWDVGLVLTEHE